jgi:predicted enzyme related to lactoylglutathione lyase
MNPPLLGSISWNDLTVPNADAVRDFYVAVAGWTVSPIDMGGYNDYCMIPPGAEVPAAGICHARGVNADLPPQWIAYITVADIAASVAACTAHGGRVIVAPREMGGGMLAVIQDPAGAVAGLYQTVGRSA